MIRFYELEVLNSNKDLIASIKIDSIENLSSWIVNERNNASFPEACYVNVWMKQLSENESHIIYLDTIIY